MLFETGPDIRQGAAPDLRLQLPVDDGDAVQAGRVTADLFFVPERLQIVQERVVALRVRLITIPLRNVAVGQPPKADDHIGSNYRSLQVRSW